MAVNFAQFIGDQTGALIYAVVENAPTDWDVSRESQDSSNQLSSKIVSSDHLSEDEAMQVLWDMKERNATRIAATTNKLAGETREQNALVAALGVWEPPVVVEP